MIGFGMAVININYCLGSNWSWQTLPNCQANFWGVHPVKPDFCRKLFFLLMCTSLGRQKSTGSQCGSKINNTLWLFNIAMECHGPFVDYFPMTLPPFLIWIFHGYVSHSQMVKFFPLADLCGFRSTRWEGGLPQGLVPDLCFIGFYREIIPIYRDL